MNVIVTGSLGYDYIMDFPGRFADRIMPDKIHKLSLSFLVDKLNKNFGGTAGNIGYTLKLLGTEPHILAPAGNDFLPYKKFLTKNKISSEFIREYEDVVTGSYFVITDQDDNQIGSFYEGALKHNHKLSLRGVAAPITFVIISPTTPSAMKRFVKECRQLKYPYLYDPAFQIDNFSADELRDGITGAQILIGNDYEIALIEKKLQITHEKLITMVPIVVTTLGSKGSTIESGKKITIKAAKAQNTSDPTGAGDAYRAGFVAGYLRGFDLTTCGQMGSVAAAYTVEQYGTQTHHFTQKAFVSRYKKSFGSVLVL